MSGLSVNALPRLHVVTDDNVLGREDFPAVAESVVTAGGAGLALHLRGPKAGGRTLYERAVVLRERTRLAGALLLINDRLDIALAADADGAQIGDRGIPWRAARELIGADRLLGVSVHDAAEASHAARAGADFIVWGTLFATPSHPGRPGSGVGAVSRTSGVGPPVIGIGGVTPERVAGVIAAGVHGVAVLRGVWDARDPAAAVRRYLEALG